MADLYEQQGHGDSNSPVAANIKQVEDRLDELNGRLELDSDGKGTTIRAVIPLFAVSRPHLQQHQQFNVDQASA